LEARVLTKGEAAFAQILQRFARPADACRAGGARFHTMAVAPLGAARDRAFTRSAMPAPDRVHPAKERLIMPHFINPDESDCCIFLSFEGELSPVEIAATHCEVDGLLQTKSWKRLIVDVTQVRSDRTPWELFDAARSMARRPRYARVGLVVRPEQVHSVRLIEKTARKDGVFLTYFVDPDKAVAWVKQVNFPGRRIDHKAAQPPAACFA
jgi:hypothetical protein